MFDEKTIFVCAYGYVCIKFPEDVALAGLEFMEILKSPACVRSDLVPRSVDGVMACVRSDPVPRSVDGVVAFVVEPRL